MGRIALVIVAILAATAAFAVPGCSSEGLGGMLSALSGEYRIPDSDCWVKISGSSVTAVDGDGQSPCLEEYFEEGDGEDSFLRKTLSIDGALSEDHIVGTMTYVETEGESWETCVYSETITQTFDLDVSQTVGKQSSGKFSALAGDWEGSLDYVDGWSAQLVAGPDCTDEPSNEGEEDITSYEIGAEIEGKEAVITYSEGGDDWGFDVEAPADDELTIDGEDIEAK
jgi:hypothetical protein